MILPEAVLQATPAAPHSAVSSGRRTPERTTSLARTSAQRVPVTTPAVRTPSTAIRYGVSTLYEAGCIPPYQARS